MRCDWSLLADEVHRSRTAGSRGGLKHQETRRLSVLVKMSNNGNPYERGLSN